MAEDDSILNEDKIMQAYGMAEDDNALTMTVCGLAEAHDKG